MPGSGSAGSETAGTGSGAEAPGSEAGGSGAGNDGTGESEPGFGDMAGAADLPSMVDTLPTFDEDYGSEGEGSGATSGARDGDENGTGGAGDTGQVAQSSDDPGGTAAQQGPGTRANGGMESEMGAEGPMTAAEQVAILDRQLEESTRDFDGIIYDEEQRQREAARERTTQTAQTAGPPDAAEGEEPDFGGGMASGGSGSVGGGIGGRSGAPPADGAKYPPPADIPSGNDDDVVARQLREAAMREPDPAVREKLWAEYRKYKGIEEPGS